jgi:DNA-binding NtrC family response regulator
VAINCATFSRELIASELFGHTEGAFSGAKRARRGIFVTAEQGTLLLDEIAELPLEQQATLLRVIEERKVRPIGSDEETPVDVRMIAATHRELDELVRTGAFREDLYARLAGFVIELPPLRERREEILALFSAFLEEGKEAKRLTRDAAEALLLYDWPRNIRELRNVASHASVLAREIIDLSALPPMVGHPAERTPERSSDDEALAKQDLRRLLEEHAGNVSEICRVTGKHRQHIYRLLRRYQLTIEDYRVDGADR